MIKLNESNFSTFKIHNPGKEKSSEHISQIPPEGQHGNHGIRPIESSICGKCYRRKRVPDEILQYADQTEQQ